MRASIANYLSVLPQSQTDIRTIPGKTYVLKNSPYHILKPATTMGRSSKIKKA